MSGKKISFGSLRQWHWISSALVLFTLLLYGISGFTLNHAQQLLGEPRMEYRDLPVPDEIKVAVQHFSPADHQPPKAVIQWLGEILRLKLERPRGRWNRSEYEMMVPRFYGSAGIKINPARGTVSYGEGAGNPIAFMNDLHKGKKFGGLWQLYMDVFAIAVVIFAITGLLLLRRHMNPKAKGGWYLGLGALLPLVVIGFMALHR